MSCVLKHLFLCVYFLKILFTFKLITCLSFNIGKYPTGSGILRPSIILKTLKGFQFDVCTKLLAYWVRCLRLYGTVLIDDATSLIHIV